MEVFAKTFVPYKPGQGFYSANNLDGSRSIEAGKHLLLNAIGMWLMYIAMPL